MLLDDYFVRDGKTFALSEAIKQRVTFEFGNLTQTPMPSTGPQDIVFCKNVAIYFRAGCDAQADRGAVTTRSTPDGYLLLGHAESLWQMSDGFTLVEHDRAFCYRKSSRMSHGTPAIWQNRRSAGLQRPPSLPTAAPNTLSLNTTSASRLFAPASGMLPNPR